MRNDDRLCAVYMLASRKHGTLYTGVSIDLMRRIWEHREGVGSSFTAKYRITRLVWFEPYDFLQLARERERAIKGWKRDWKTNLIERANPDWDDLYPKLVAGRGVSAKLWKPPSA